MNKKIKENILGTPTPNKTMVNIRKADLGDPKVTGNIQKLGKDVNVNVVEVEHDVLNPEAVITPQDNATIKYLSNVKDSKTGKISQPFTIGAQKYQMVRGITGDKQIVMAVFAHDETDDNGENVIYPVEYFEENIANPMKEQMDMVGQVVEKENEYDYAADERQFNDKEELMNYLNLSDIKPGYKLFFVNLRTGKIVGQFKNTKEMVHSGLKLGPDEDFMDLKSLKRFRFGDYFNKDLNEMDGDGTTDNMTDGTNLGKLQTDVKRLTSLIKNKFSVYLSKLDKPIEQAQFLTAMAQQIGVPLNKLSKIISTYKDIAKSEPVNEPQPVSEKKVITKNMLENKVKKIRVIKVKDLQ